MTPVASARPKMLPALTGVRFFAALAVLLFHFGAGFFARLGAPAPVVTLLQNGYLGVSLFFVLSGFIITYTHHKDGFSGSSLGKFYVARIARVYPVYLLALLLALPVLQAPLSLDGAVSVLLMVQAWTPPADEYGFTWVTQAWTLSIEAFFYILFPFAWLVFRSFSRVGVVIALCVSVGVMVLFGTPTIGPGIHNIPLLGAGTQIWIPVFRMAEFAFGITLCQIFVLYPGISRRFGGSIAECAVFALIVIVMATAQSMQAKALFTVLAGLFILMTADGKGVLTKFLSSPVLLLLGGASYGMYILQGPVRAICAALIPAPLDQFVNPFAIIGFSILVFLYFEQPARRRVLEGFSAMRAWRSRTQTP